MRARASSRCPPDKCLTRVPLAADAESLRAYFTRFGNVIDAVVMREPDTAKSRGFGFVVMESMASVVAALQCREHVIDGRRVEAKPAVPRDASSAAARPRPVEPPAPVHTPATVAGDMLMPDMFSFRKIFVGGLHYDTKEGARSNQLRAAQTFRSAPLKRFAPRRSTRRVLTYRSPAATLRSYFEVFGHIEAIQIMYNRETNRSRGFGFVVFANESSVQQVLRSRLHTIDNKTVEVKRAIPRTEPRRGSGRQLPASAPAGAIVPARQPAPTLQPPPPPRPISAWPAPAAGHRRGDGGHHPPHTDHGGRVSSQQQQQQQQQWMSRMRSDAAAAAAAAAAAVAAAHRGASPYASPALMSTPSQPLMHRAHVGDGRKPSIPRQRGSRHLGAHPPSSHARHAPTCTHCGRVDERDVCSGGSCSVDHSHRMVDAHAFDGHHSHAGPHGGPARSHSHSHGHGHGHAPASATAHAHGRFLHGASPWPRAHYASQVDAHAPGSWPDAGSYERGMAADAVPGSVSPAVAESWQLMGAHGAGAETSLRSMLEDEAAARRRHSVHRSTVEDRGRGRAFLADSAPHMPRPTDSTALYGAEGLAPRSWSDRNVPYASGARAIAVPGAEEDAAAHTSSSLGLSSSSIYTASSSFSRGLGPSSAAYTSELSSSGHSISTLHSTAQQHMLVHGHHGGHGVHVGSTAKPPTSGPLEAMFASLSMHTATSDRAAAATRPPPQPSMSDHMGRASTASHSSASVHVQSAEDAQTASDAGSRADWRGGQLATVDETVGGGKREAAETEETLVRVGSSRSDIAEAASAVPGLRFLPDRSVTAQPVSSTVSPTPPTISSAVSCDAMHPRERRFSGTDGSLRGRLDGRAELAFDDAWSPSFMSDSLHGYD